MKVLIVSQYFFPEKFLINSLAAGLSEKNFQVDVITGQPNYPNGVYYKGYGSLFPKKEQMLGCVVWRAPIFARKNATSLRLVLNYVSFVLTASFLGIFLAYRKKPDVILAFANSPISQVLPAIICKKIFKIPVIIWLQDVWPEAVSASGHVSSKIILKFIHKLVAFIYRNSDLILLQSKQMDKKVVRYSTKGFPPLKFFPNFVSSHLQTKLATKEAKNISKFLNNSFNLVIAGNIGFAQNGENILEAIKICQRTANVTLHFIGEGTNRKRLQNISNSQKIKGVYFHSQVSSNELAYILTQASATLVSLCDDEGLNSTIPSRLQFYFAAGKPILCAAKGATAELVAESQAGFCCNPNDPENIAETILKLHRLSKQEHEKLGKQSSMFFSSQFAEAPAIERMAKTLRQYARKG